MYDLRFTLQSESKFLLKKFPLVFFLEACPLSRSRKLWRPMTIDVDWVKNAKIATSIIHGHVVHSDELESRSSNHGARITVWTGAELTVPHEYMPLAKALS
jgi:hypothetical protein